MSDAHAIIDILSSSLSTCRVSYHVRTVPPRLMKEMASLFDYLVERSFRSVAIFPCLKVCEQSFNSR